MDIRTKTPKSNQSSTRRAYLTLREEIISGKISPGARLKVETLKISLNTGSAPVREALSLLTSDQLVERLDQRGFRVAQTSKAQFQEILKLRCNFEDLALRESVKNGDQDWEEKLVLAKHHMTRAKDADPVELEVRHKEFHMALISACDSPILLRFCEQLYDLNVRYRNLAGKAKSYARRDVDAEHLAILEATIDRNGELASTLLVAHFTKTGAFLADLID